MIPETPVNWKVFEYKYADNPQKAFENLTYYLFCHEFNQSKGIFRYFNQPHIETNPIQIKDKLIGFQSKYYKDSITMSSKESELKNAVEGVARSYPGITTLYFYISREFSPSSKKDEVKPSYQDNIENMAKKLGIEIVWRGISNIEAQLMQDSNLTVCRNVFFQTDSAVQKCCESLDKHKDDIFNHINTNILYKGNSIVLDYDEFNFGDFISSDNQVLIVDGNAGSGKSSLIKNIAANVDEKTVFLAFKSTDMDVDDKLKFLTLHGSLTIDELLEVYREEDNRILYIDAVEKYFVLENQQIFEEIFQDFLNEGWRLILTIRTAYKESFHNLLLNKVKVKHYHVNLIGYDRLLELSATYDFKIPSDKKLTELLCEPFYLNLYLSLNNLNDGDLSALNREAFEVKIWEDIIRNNKRRKNNLPTRRENFLKSITMEMLKNESYSYVIQATDDYEVLSELEQNGVIVPIDDGKKYCHGHDVFEELVVSHIFTEQYKNNMNVNQFVAQFRTSLRIRKLFRGWLSDFASIKEHQDIVFQILESKDVNRIWKDEVLLTIISTENLKDIYYKITSNMADNNCEMLKKIAFLINTCCRVADHTDIYLNKGSLLPFRLSKPFGYAWESLFCFIADNKEFILWDKELISVIIEVLDSWTKHIGHAKTKNTKKAGEIGIFLYEKMSNDKDFYYSLKSEQISKLQDVLVNSAWMIKEQLRQIFQIVIAGVKYDEIDDPILFTSVNRKNYAPRMYVNLAERVIGDIYHYGNVPNALPEMTFELMKRLWIRPSRTVSYHRADIEGNFGLQSLSNTYYPASASKTPISTMLLHDYKQTTDFLIDFFNQIGDEYVHSHLNRDYGECYRIILYVNGQKIEQIASDRIWKLHRGTHVGPNLLISLLMGFETWLLKVAEVSESKVVVDYCRNILTKSQNVMLTAVIVSVAEAYPDKMLDLICDFIKTKEIFYLDSSRVESENKASYFLFGDNLFGKECRKSNKLPHRKKRLEDVILNFQIYHEGESQDDVMLRKEKIYHAIDEVTADIDTWEVDYKYAYYRMDIRHYREVVNVQSDDKGNEIGTLMPDYTQEMKEQSKQSQETFNHLMKYADLQLWSDYKFHNDRRFQEYEKYNDVNIVCGELRELWELLNEDGSEDNNGYGDNLLTTYRYVSIISYTSTVLLRDYNANLTDEDRELCEHIIHEMANVFIHISNFEFSQAGNGLSAIVAGLVLLLNSDNKKLADDENPFYKIIKLLIKDWGNESTVVKEIVSTIWEYDNQTGCCLIHAFSLLADQYLKEIRKDREFSIDTFFEGYKSVIENILANETPDITAIDFSALSKEAMFTCISLVAADAEEAVFIAEATKEIAMRLTFGDKDNERNEYTDLIGYYFNYVIWFADVLLHCDDAARKRLIDAFIEKADFTRNDNVEQLFIWLIQEQEVWGKEKEFWNIWELLKPYMIMFSREKEQYYYSDYSRPIGKDRIITAYLFANSSWKEGVHQCALLSEERAVFFDDFIDRAGSTKAIFYAISRLLNSVGMEPYKEKGIDWIYKLVQKDSECKMTLYNNTLFYLEEYVGNFVASHRMEFRINADIAQKTQNILEYMVNQGSQIAFFVREQI